FEAERALVRHLVGVRVARLRLATLRGPRTERGRVEAAGAHAQVVQAEAPAHTQPVGELVLRKGVTDDARSALLRLRLARHPDRVQVRRLGEVAAVLVEDGEDRRVRDRVRPRAVNVVVRAGAIRDAARERDVRAELEWARSS